tara:strand:+ start:16126 stop:16272 length:147 start_codon:yes stop_codon:yes gene_type:complete
VHIFGIFVLEGYAHSSIVDILDILSKKVTVVLLTFLGISFFLGQITTQ